MRTRIGLIVVATAAVLAPSALGHQPSGGGASPATNAAAGRTLQGILRVSHADDRTTRRAIWRGTLTSGGRTYRVVNARELDGLGDRRVRVSVRMLGKGRISVQRTSLKVLGRVPAQRRLTRERLLAEGLRDGVLPRASKRREAKAIGGNRKVAVLLVNFSDNLAQPFTPTQVRNALFSSDPQSMNSYFQAMSAGAISFSGHLSSTGDVFGYYTVANPGSGCNVLEWGDAARAQARLAGVDFTPYQHIAYVWPTRCNGASFGIQPNLPGPAANEVTEAWLDGTLDLHVAAHEFGHNLGLSHGYALDCPDVSQGRASLRHPGEGAACVEREYEDPFGVMGGFDTVDTGSFAYELPARQRLQLGWFQPSQVQTVSASGAYQLTPLATVGGPKELRVEHCSPLTGSPESFSIEYRRPTGFDGGVRPVAEGLYIRLARNGETYGGTVYGAQPRLIDTTPLTATFLDAALGLGQTFVDARDGITITPLSFGPAGASVQVQFGPDAVAPATPLVTLAPAAEVAGGTPTRIVDVPKRVPPSIRLVWQPTTECHGPATSYRVARDGVSLASVSTPGFTDPTLAQTNPGGLLSYTVSAVDANGNVSAPSSPVAALAPDVTAPTVPAALKVTRSDATRRLSWGASTDNAPGVRYGVYANGTLLDETSATNYIDARGVRDGTRLEYQVVAFDATGNPSTPTAISAITIGATSSNVRRLVQFTLRRGGPVKLTVTKGGRTVATLRRVGKKGKNRVVLPTNVVRASGRYVVRVTQPGAKTILVSVRV